MHEPSTRDFSGGQLESARNSGRPVSGDTVRGTDFWKVGALGAAGSFSNNAGRRVLTERLKGALPRVKAT